MELIAYAVLRPNERLEDISTLRRDRATAWREYLGEDLVDRDLEQRVRQVSSMEGVRLACFRIVPSGYRDL